MEELSSWMESDLLAILNNFGYAGIRVDDANVTAGPGRFVLLVHVKAYDAGSRAARLLIGFNAGGATLDTHFELKGEGGTSLVAGDPSIRAGGDGRHAARRINMQTINAVDAYLRRGGVLSETRPVRPNASVSGATPTRKDEPGHMEFEAGRDAYDQGDFAKALTHFERAHAQSGRVELLFNIGRAADSDGQARRAIEAYEAYLTASPNATNTNFVRSRISKMRGLERSQARPAPNKRPR